MTIKNVLFTFIYQVALSGFDRCLRLYKDRARKYVSYPNHIKYTKQ